WWIMKNSPPARRSARWSTRKPASKTPSPPTSGRRFANGRFPRVSRPIPWTRFAKVGTSSALPRNGAGGRCPRTPVMRNGGRRFLSRFGAGLPPARSLENELEIEPPHNLHHSRRIGDACDLAETCAGRVDNGIAESHPIKNIQRVRLKG